MVETNSLSSSTVVGNTKSGSLLLLVELDEVVVLELEEELLELDELLILEELLLDVVEELLETVELLTSVEDEVEVLEEVVVLLATEELVLVVELTTELELLEVVLLELVDDDVLEVPWPAHDAKTSMLNGSVNNNYFINLSLLN